MSDKEQGVLTPGGAPIVATRRPRRRLGRWLVAALLLMTAAALVWWLRPVHAVPPMPGGIEDAEVLDAITRARAKAMKDTGSALAWGQYAKVLLAQQFDREADQCFAEAARLDPADPRWPYGRFVIAAKRDPDRALPLLRRALEVRDEKWADFRSIMHLRMADELLERGMLDEAAEHLRAVEARNSLDLHVALGLGLIAKARGDTATAVRLLTVARDSPSARRFATGQLAALALARGERDLANAYEREAAAMLPDAVWPNGFMEEIAALGVGQRAFERRVRNLEQTRQHTAAAQLYLERLKSRPSAELYVGAGSNFAVQRDYESALPLLRKAIELEPGSANAHYWLGLALFSRAERAWHRTPDAADVKEGFREAAVHGQRAAEIRPGHGKSYMVWGLALKYLGKPAEAIAPLRIGVACQPADLELQLGLGQALLDAGRGAEAKPYLENALRLAPPHDPRPAEALKRLRASSVYQQ